MNTDTAPRSSRDEAVPPQPMLLTLVEAARVLAVGRTTIYQLLARRELQSVRIGRARRVPMSAIVDYVERLKDPIPNATPSSYAPDVHNGGGLRGIG